MELKKHNDVLAEIEKLLDGNLANVDPVKHAELVEERDRLLSEQRELTAAIAIMQTESDALVDKVVETEAERDKYKTKLDEIEAGVGAQHSKIEELLNKISELEAEIERRDAVVIKMAQKYQLVEKDEFAEGLESQANDDSTLQFMQEQPKKD
jgi:uncharacterized coiled-coil DUF342 family protein